MAYFRIFSSGKQQWWRQDGLAYTDECNAGFWPEEALAVMGLDDSHKIVPFTPDILTQGLIERGLYDFGDLSPVDGCSKGESERLELTRERDGLWNREAISYLTETVMGYKPEWMSKSTHD
ncbi:hypothetical protein D3981_004343 [Escherichia coli]|nr:hypothetical protein [Escherichia coli]